MYTSKQYIGTKSQLSNIINSGSETETNDVISALQSIEFQAILDLPA